MKAKPSVILFFTIGVLLVLSSSTVMFFASFWSNWPFLFLSGVAFLIAGHLLNDCHEFKVIGLALSSGIILGLGHLHTPLGYLDFFGFCPILFLMQMRKNGDLRSSHFYRALYLSFCMWNIISTFWVMNTAFIAGIISIFLNALFMTFPFRFFILIERYFKGQLTLLLLASFWLAFEYGHASWEISWPWLTLGNAFSSCVWMVQWYEYTGVYGGSLWILCANIALFKAFHTRTIKAGLIFCTIILFPIIISVLIGIKTNVNTGQKRQVCIVQPNYDPHYEKFQIPAFIQMERLMELAKNCLNTNSDYLIFPETVFDNINLNSLNDNRILSSFFDMTRQYKNLSLVTGLGGYYFVDRDHPLYPESIGVQLDGRDTNYCVANAAVLLGESTKQQLYFKSKFVPGAEIFPYRNLLFFLKPLIRKLGGADIGWMTQSDRIPFYTKKDTIAPIICYENEYGNYLADFVRNGAQALFVMTNDGWWDDTPGHIQHLNFSKLRCIETRKWMARSANVGCSCIIDPKGEVLDKVEYRKEAIIQGEIYLNSEKTIYVRYGDWILWCVFIFSGIYLCLNIYRRNF